MRWQVGKLARANATRFATSSTCPNCGGLLEKTPSGGLGCFLVYYAGIGSEEETLHDSMPDALEKACAVSMKSIVANGRLYELGRGR